MFELPANAASSQVASQPRHGLRNLPAPIPSPPAALTYCDRRPYRPPLCVRQKLDLQRAQAAQASERHRLTPANQMASGTSVSPHAPDGLRRFPAIQLAVGRCLQKGHDMFCPAPQRGRPLLSAVQVQPQLSLLGPPLTHQACKLLAHRHSFFPESVTHRHQVHQSPSHQSTSTRLTRGPKLGCASISHPKSLIWLTLRGKQVSHVKGPRSAHRTGTALPPSRSSASSLLAARLSHKFTHSALPDQDSIRNQVGDTETDCI